MGKEDELVIIVKTYDLLKWSCEHLTLKRWPEFFGRLKLSDEVSQVKFRLSSCVAVTEGGWDRMKNREQGAW